MTFYRRQRMESFKRAMFAGQLSKSPSQAPAQPQPQLQGADAIWVPGILTGSGMAAGQLAS